MIILFIGPPACGKDTQARLLSNVINLPVITPGVMLRSIDKSSSFFSKINGVMSKGYLVDSEFVALMLKSELSKPEYKNGYILNGWFRQIQDKNYFDPEIDKVIYLNISKESALQRTQARYMCEAEGHIYNLMVQKPKIEGICDIDGSKLVKRKDDKQDTFEVRYQIFCTKTMEVIDYFRNKGVLIEIDAENDQEMVHTDILTKLKL